MALGDQVLDRLALRPLEDQGHWRVFSTRHPAGEPIDRQALSANPVSTARFSRALAGAAMFYVGQRERTALWESILQHASIDEERCVYLFPTHLADQAIVRLARDDTDAPDCLDLRAPYRYQVVDQNTGRDAAWMGWLTAIGDYSPTYEAAENAHRQFAHGNQSMSAITYPSRRFNADYAAVFYTAPGANVPWIVAETPWRLDRTEGETRLAERLAEDGFSWVGDPAADPAATPDPGAL